MQIVKLLLTSPTDSANRSIKVTEGLQGWSSFITSSRVRAAAVISPGDATPPLSLLPFRGVVSASLCDYTAKFGAASYMPSAKYSQYFFLPQPERLPANWKQSSLTALLSVSDYPPSDFTLHFLSLAHRCTRRTWALHAELFIAVGKSLPVIYTQIRGFIKCFLKP